MFDWITGFVDQSGYVGIALLMLAENVFPPIPSELIMPLAGHVAASGKLNIAGVILAGLAGSLAGALFWYWIGRWIGADRLIRWSGRHGRWLTLHPADVCRALDWFDRSGWVAVFIGRMVPTIRTLISVPAGIARMPLLPFILYSALGTSIWTGGLAGVGYVLRSQFSQATGWLNVVSNAIVGVIVLVYVYRVLTFKRTKM